jgi:hypothetical protein
MAVQPAATQDDPWTMTLDDPAADPTAPAAKPKQGITDPAVTPGWQAPPATPVNGAADTSGLTSSDPAARIDALYSQAGIKDGGRGSGFADRAYWLEHPSEILNGRLAADLAGTGTDQPTGTPGRGAWLNSGRNAPEAGIGQPTRDANGGFWDPASVMVQPGAAAATTVPGITMATGTDTSSRDALLQQLLAEMMGKNPQPAATGGGAGGGEDVTPEGPKP